MQQNLGLFFALLRRLRLPRKVEAGIGIAALILGQIFPEHNLLANMIAGAMLADSATRIKQRGKNEDTHSCADADLADHNRRRD